LGVGVLLLMSGQAQAANLVDVRIGVHEKYTRVVLETDAKTPYRIESSSGDELVLSLSASSGSRLIASKQSAHLLSVLVKPTEPGASQVRIALRGPVDVKKTVLSGPPRIVLDLSQTEVMKSVAPTTTAPVAPPRSKPPTPILTPAVSSEPKPASAAAPQKPAPPLRPPSELAQPAAPEPEKKPETAVPSASEPDPGASLTAREPAKPPTPAPSKPSTTPRRIATPPPPATRPGLLDALPAPLNEPFILGALLAGLILVLALVAMRRRAAGRDDEPITPFAAGEPFSVDEQPGDVAVPWAEPGEAALSPEPEVAAGGEPSLFDQPAEARPPLGEQEARGSTMDQPEVVEAAAAGGPAPTVGASREFEQRLSQLEARLEDVLEAKERLERQVAAQTEELRVQRAAIARTQRVLRNLTRPDEEATEPAPKT
jgi:hypothetical protein